MRSQLMKMISFKAGTKDSWIEDGSDSCSHYSGSTKQSAGGASSFSLLRSASRTSPIYSRHQFLVALHWALITTHNAGRKTARTSAITALFTPSSTKQNTMSVSGLFSKSLQGKTISWGGSVDNGISSLASLSGRLLQHKLRQPSRTIYLSKLRQDGRGSLIPL
jgi:hypothetical protein